MAVKYATTVPQSVIKGLFDSSKRLQCLRCGVVRHSVKDVLPCKCCGASAIPCTARMANVASLFHLLGYSVVEADSFFSKVDYANGVGNGFTTVMVRVDFGGCTAAEAFPDLPDGYFYYKMDKEKCRITYREDFYDFSTNMTPQKLIDAAIKLLYKWVVDLETSNAAGIFKLAGYM